MDNIVVPFLTHGVHPFNGLFSRTTCVSLHQKGKPFWILLVQEIMTWQWHQLDHMQIICTSLQTDNHASTQFLQTGCPSCHPTNSVKAPKASCEHLSEKKLFDCLRSFADCCQANSAKALRHCCQWHKKN